MTNLKETLRIIRRHGETSTTWINYNACAIYRQRRDVLPRNGLKLPVTSMILQGDMYFINFHIIICSLLYFRFLPVSNTLINLQSYM
jgi:hypothetical protein